MDKLAVIAAIEVAEETVQMLKARELSTDVLAVVIAVLIGAEATLRDRSPTDVGMSLGALAETLAQITRERESLDGEGEPNKN